MTGLLAFGVTTFDVETVLSQHLRPGSPSGKSVSISDLADQVFSQWLSGAELSRIQDAALAARCDLEAQTEAAHEEIRRLLIEQGLLSGADVSTSMDASPQVKTNSDAGAEIFPGATLQEILSVDLATVVGSCSAEQAISAWKWIGSNACFSSVPRLSSKSTPAVSGFVLRLDDSLTNIPDVLAALLSKARESHFTYVLFHQG